MQKEREGACRHKVKGRHAIRGETWQHDRVGTFEKTFTLSVHVHIKHKWLRLVRVVFNPVYIVAWVLKYFNQSLTCEITQSVEGGW